MKVFIENGKITKELEFSGTVRDLLKKLEINEHTVIITNNKKILQLDDKVNNNDRISIRDVVIGG
ncbi:MAG: MoaD/ThiS family protein [Candidatus Woesearchaeota archaeon]|jgi:sulfur carrier protein ThiS